MRRFNQIADNLIVKILDVGPCDSFALILLLFLFQYKLNEKLLKLLVAVIDAENGMKLKR